jgi:cephalosporin hydroxylase
MAVQETVDDFCKLYYESHEKTWQNTYWMGILAEKCPLDLWIFQEIMYEVKPDVIIETGTYQAGTTFYLAALCDILGHGKVITIDKHCINTRHHDRIVYLYGSSGEKNIAEEVGKFINEGDKVMAILDSRHMKFHVRKELDLYSRYISVGSYIIVEDTIISGHPIKNDYPEGGPWEAVEEFLKANDNFVIDHSREKFYMTFNRNGYLKRIQ